MSTAPLVLEIIEQRRKRRRSNVAPVVRVLRIEPGSKTDRFGRALGDDWQLASFGCGTDGAEYYLTTDGLHASEMLDVDGLEPGELAKALAKLVNARWRRRVEKRGAP